jgi:lipid II:glycine glycyltransferase (peptidoglycan interpeptide bridge formation enzyme)
MLSWSAWQGEAGGWDALLAKFPDRNIFQSYGWGEHKSHFGWQPYRMVAVDKDQTVALAQVLLRRFPFGVSLAWVNGGPVGLPNAWGEPLRAAIRKAAGTRHLYCRINPMREQSEPDLEIMRSSGWCTPTHAVGSGQSILLDLKPDDSEWLKSIAGKHRYYVKKSNGAALEWVCGNSESLRRDLAALTQCLVVEKGLVLPEWDGHTIEDLNRRIGDGVCILIGYLNAKPVTGCLVLVQGAAAHYLSAATLKEGRDVSAAYSMFAKIRSLLRERGVYLLDFGGINPASEKARGVDHFKGGFGGRQIKYLGERDWANTSILRHVANLLIKRRMRSM